MTAYISVGNYLLHSIVLVALMGTLLLSCDGGALFACFFSDDIEGLMLPFLKTKCVLLCWLVFRGYSLMVTRLPSLTSLGLRSLRKINDGGVYITANKRLCYHDTVNWTRLFSSSSRQQRRHKTIDIKDNRPRNECGEWRLRSGVESCCW